MRRLSQRLLAAAISVALVFIGLEVMAKYLPSFRAPMPAAEPMYLSDPVLGARPNPKYADHDADGWRNAARLAKADVVVLGDSQTYGLAADREHAWPQQMSRVLQRPVYQIAFGGYNPTTFLRLMPDVLSREPKAIVLGIYFGANFAQAYEDVYNRAQDPELERLKSSNPQVLDLLSTANEIDGKWERARYLDCQRPRPPPHPSLLTIENILNVPPLLAWVQSDPIWAFIEARSRVIRDVQYRVKEARVVEQPAPICVHYVDGPVRTILSPAYRLLNLERTDPRIVEGERVVIAAVKRLAQIAEAHGAALFVVLIPTKELAFEFSPPSKRSPELRYLIRLWQLETAARKRVSAALSSHGIEVIDALPPLQGLIAVGTDPYLGMDANGHPSAVGYAAIAQTVAAVLRESLR